MPAPNLAIFVKMSGGMLPPNTRAGDLEIYDNGKMLIFESDTDIVERKIDRQQVLNILQTARQNGFFSQPNIIHDNGNAPNVPDVTISLLDSGGSATVTTTGYQKLKGDLRKNPFDVAYKMITDIAWDAYTNGTTPTVESTPAPVMPQQAIPEPKAPAVPFDLPSLDDLLKSSGLSAALENAAPLPSNTPAAVSDKPQVSSIPAIDDLTDMQKEMNAAPSLPPLPSLGDYMAMQGDNLSLPPLNMQYNDAPPQNIPKQGQQNQQRPQQGQQNRPPQQNNPPAQSGGQKPVQPLQPQKITLNPNNQQKPQQAPQQPKQQSDQGVQQPRPEPAKIQVQEPPRQKPPEIKLENQSQPPREPERTEQRNQPLQQTQRDTQNQLPDQRQQPRPEIKPREQQERRNDQSVQQPIQSDNKPPRVENNEETRLPQQVKPIIKDESFVPVKPEAQLPEMKREEPPRIVIPKIDLKKIEKPIEKQPEPQQKVSYKKPPIGWDYTQELVTRLEETLHGKLLVIYMSENHTLTMDDVRYIYSHLRKIGNKKTLYVLPIIPAGQMTVVWRFATLLREFCQELHFILPDASSVQSTMLALSGDSVLMNPLGYMSPIMEDFSHELLGTIKYPLQDIVKASQKNTSSKKDDTGYSEQALSPLVITAAQRQQDLIRLLSGNLLQLGMKNETKEHLGEIVDALTFNYPSSEYPITFFEVKKIGLPVKETTEEMNDLLWELMQQYVYLTQPVVTIRDIYKTVEAQQVIIESIGRRTIYYVEEHDDLKLNRPIDYHRRWRELTQHLSVNPQGKEHSELVWKELQIIERGE